jgi:RND family efflux transporter MFP subunit
MRPLLFGLILLLVLSGCSKPPAEEPEAERPRPVQVAEVRKGAIQRTVTADGILRAIDQSPVSAKISAPVKQFLVNRGDHVRAGQLLAVLESADLTAAAADAKGAYEQSAATYRTVSASSVLEEQGKAQADVEAAKQALDAAQKLLESRQELFRQGALARRLVDEASVSYAQARSQYDIAQRHLESFSSVARQETVNGAAGQRDSARGKYDAALAQLSYAELRSPISGVIAERPAFAGEMANAGTPLLTVMDVSRVIARVNVPVAEAKYIRVGQPSKIVATDGSGEVLGKVTVVSPAVDPQSTTVEVWVEAENPGEKLRPGGTVHVTITADTVSGATLVPPSALYPSQEGGSAVILVEDGTAKQEKVEVGIRNQDWVQILTDLKPGSRVVTEGGLGLEDGVKVSVESPDAPKAGAKEDADEK